MKRYREIIKLYERRKYFYLLIFLNSILITTVIILPKFIAKIVDNIGNDRIYKYLFISLGIILLKESVNVIYAFKQQKSRQMIEKKMIGKVIGDWMKIEEQERNGIGYIKVFENLKNDCGEVAQMASSTVFFILENLVKLVLASLIVLKFNCLIFLILFFTGILAYFLYYNKVGRKQKEIESYHFHSLQKIDHWMVGIYDSNEFLSINNLKEWAKRNLIKDIEKNYRIRTLQNTYSTLKDRLSYLPIWISESLLYIFGGFMVIQDKITLGELLALISYASLVLKAVRNLLNSRNSFQVQMNSYNRLSELSQEGGKNDVNCYKEEGRNKLVMDSITFRYGDNLVFDDVNLELPLQGMVLVQGGNGAGKSTLLKIIKGDLKIEQGSVTIDGQKTSLDVGYQYLSQVNQRDVIMNDTFENNIVLFDEQNKVDIKELMDRIIAIPGADSNDMVNYDNLSGGEKRSLSTARALYHKKSILLLDEADTGMDQERWNNMVQYLRDVASTTLIIAITHRELSNKELLKWDYIINIHNNKVNIYSLKIQYIKVLIKTSNMYKKLGKTEICKVKTHGFSMLPIIPMNSEVDVEIGALDYKVDDIVLFSIYDKLIAHRIVSMDNDIIKCKGDNAIGFETITNENIIGKIIRIN